MPRVAVVREQLFKASEPFIAMQALAQTDYRPVFVGATCEGAAPPEVDVVLPASRAGLLHHKVTGSGMTWVQGLARYRPAVVHAHFAVDGLMAVDLAERLRAPLVVTLHGFDVTRSRGSLLRARSPVLTRYALARGPLLARAALFLCVSDFIRDAAADAGFPEDRLVVHHLGSAVPRNAPDLAAPRDVRIAHVARLVEKKGTAHLIAALAEVHRALPAVRLDVVGDGPLRRALTQQVARLGLEDSVTFHGYLPVEQTQEVVRSAQVLCLPSVIASDGDAEGLGMVLLEAAAAGTSIVASDVGGVPDFVRDDVTGRLVAPGDERALGRALLEALRDPALRRRLAEGAWRRLVSDFDVRSQGAVLDRRLEEVVRRCASTS